MKNSITPKILALLIAVCCCFGFTACNFKGTSVLDVATQNGLVSTESEEENETPTETPVNVTEYNTTVNRETNEISLYDTYLELKEYENYTGSFSDFLKEYLDDSNSVSNSVEYASNKCLMSAVAVYSTFTKYYNPNYTYMSAGAGVIYKLDKTTGDAYIITNYHVVYSNDSSTGISNDIICYTYGQFIGVSTPLTCTFVGGSMQYDLAVLKVTASEQLKNDDSMAITLADSDTVTVGETIVAIGNPESDGISATTGVVCVDSEHITMKSVDNTTSFDHRVIRVDAAINEGNSGGGVFNTSGELVGIANVKIVDSSVDNIAYAIPSNIVKYICDAVIRQCNGTSVTSIKRAIIGITVQIVESSAYYNGQKTEIIETLKITEINSDSLVNGILTLNSTLNKIVITDNTDPLNPIQKEYNTSRLFHIEAMLQLQVEDQVTFYTSNEDGSPLEPKTVTITSECFIDVK